jgi:3-hydroxyisobutyrate dehydrogenase
MNNAYNKLRIGFIGLGLMGSHMTANLLKAGYPLVVFNRTLSKTEKLRKLGASVSKSPAEMAKEVDVVISMVTAPKDVEEVYLGKNGVIKGAKNGLIAIDMETIGPSTAIKVGKTLNKYGISFIDAPVTGGLKGAADATLTIFVGGQEKILEKVKPILSAMGKKISYMGPVGSGQAIKLVNNLITAESMIIISETLLFAENIGINRKKMAETLEGGPALSLFMSQRLPNMANDDYPTRFSLNNMYKDVLLAVAELRKNPSLFRRLRFSSQVLKIYEKAVKMGYGDADFAAVFKAIDK